MSSQVQTPIKRITVPEIRARKGSEPIVVLTAYDAPMAALLDPHCDVLLVGDSLGMAVHGLPNTVGVTLEMMILHGQAVMRGAKRAMVVVDMPFGSYEGGKEIAYANCVRVMQETGAQAVKLETSIEMAEIVAFLVKRGIPVMGHVGLRPQAVLVDGGFKAKGKAKGKGQRKIGFHDVASFQVGPVGASLRSGPMTSAPRRGRPLSGWQRSGVPSRVERRRRWRQLRGCRQCQGARHGRRRRSSWGAGGCWLG